MTVPNAKLGPKRLELLHEWAPTAITIALLVHPANRNVEGLSTDLQAAARTLGLQLNILRASTDRLARPCSVMLVFPHGPRFEFTPLPRFHRSFLESGKCDFSATLGKFFTPVIEPDIFSVPLSPVGNRGGAPWASIL